jgi:hypothetical protein
LAGLTTRGGEAAAHALYRLAVLSLLADCLRLDLCGLRRQRLDLLFLLLRLPLRKRPVGETDARRWR